MRRTTPAFALVAASFFLAAPASAAPAMRVCADPNNLPFSNDRGEGFENRIVALLAHDLGREVHYTWWAQRRGFLRNTLTAGLCDVVPGVPSSLEMLATTRPYYRSTYVFVSRANRGPPVACFDDPRLRPATEPSGDHLRPGRLRSAPRRPSGPWRVAAATRPPRSLFGCELSEAISASSPSPQARRTRSTGSRERPRAVRLYSTRGGTSA